MNMRETIRKLSISLGGILIGFIVAAIIIALQGKPIGSSMRALFEGSFGSSFAIGNTLNKAAPLLLVALGFMLANAAGLVSIGGEGQIFIGGTFAVAAGLAASDLPQPLPLICALIAGFIGGGLWSAIAGWLRARLGVNEVIATLLLNYIAINITEYAVDQKGLLRDGEAEPQSRELPGVARLGRLFPDSTSQLHFGVIIALIAAIAVWFILRRTVPGFRIRMLGKNPQVAARNGVSLRSMSVGVMFGAGGLAGLAGTSMLLGEQFRLRPGFSPGYGFDGIAVALIANNNPIAAIPAAILFGALRAGGNLLEAQVQVPQALVIVIQGTIIFAVAGMAYLQKRIKTPVVVADPPTGNDTGGSGGTSGSTSSGSTSGPAQTAVAQ
jgi:general nucleoside transport system permease protein